jgi:hypothetical protein
MGGLQYDERLTKGRTVSGLEAFGHDIALAVDNAGAVGLDDGHVVK